MEIIEVLGIFAVFIIAYKNEEKINQLLFKSKALKRVTPYLICLLIAFSFAVKLNLSPFNSDSPGTDSSVFLYIGKAMHNGAVPYVDVFDHKGVVLYFIEYIGYLLGFGNAIGVWFIEIINIYATVVVFYHIAKLFSSSSIICCLSSYIVIQLSTLPFFVGEGGNLTEEYALPWIALSLYYVVKFFKTKEYKNYDIILIGVGFAVVFFLRVNMVGLWGALLLLVTVYFIKNKQLPDLIKSGLLFAFGVVLVCIPLLVYLYFTNSLQAMIDYYFVFNFSYTDSAYGASSSKMTIVFFFLKCVEYAGISVFFIVYSFILDHKNKLLWVNLITLIFAYASANISGRPYPHYDIILAPLFVIPTVISLSPIMEKSKEIMVPVKRKGVLVLIVAGCLMLSVAKPALSVLRDNSKTSEIQSFLAENTNENDDVLILGNFNYEYINSNRQTKNKFFYQIPPIDVSEKLYNEFISELEKNQSDYIVNPVAVKDYIDDNSNYEKIIEYLNNECKKGTYHMETHEDFSVYIRK